MSRQPGFYALIFLLIMPVAALSALTPGVRLNAGLSGGIGEGWNEVLEDAGNRDFNDAALCAGFSAFMDIPLEQGFLFSPELGVAVNRGARLSNSDGDSVEITTPILLELIIPLARDFESPGGNRAFRLMGGLQAQYAFGVWLKTNVDGYEETVERDNDSPLAVGLVLGTGWEFWRQRKRSWFLDLRLKVPFSNTISYESGDGGEYQIMDWQLLLGAGFKFH